MVAGMNEAGLLMDCSHTGRRCSLEIIDASALPVVFSHSNPLALVDHARNVTDEQIRACAARGGVVCVSGVSAFVGAHEPRAADVARHVAYVANLVGAEHAGIGLDICFKQADIDDDPPGEFDPGYWWPRSAGYGQGITAMNFAPVDTWRELPAALSATGMTASEIALVMGDNMARVARATWGG
jgi:membrane dipeptidase